jgi:hypothetical protein
MQTVRRWIVVRRAPMAVRDLYAAWRLDKKVQQIALAPYQPDVRPPAPPAPPPKATVVLDTLPSGIKIARP